MRCKSRVGKVCTHKKDRRSLVTGCLKNTPVNKMYTLSGRAGSGYKPESRRSVQTDWERTKVINNI